jgi:hypothetical protein
MLAPTSRSISSDQASTDRRVRLDDFVPTSGSACRLAFRGESCRPRLFEDFDADGVEEVFDHCAALRSGGAPRPARFARTRTGRSLPIDRFAPCLALQVPRIEA